MFWELISLVAIGTPEQRWETLDNGLSWEQCIARQFTEVRRLARINPDGPNVVRCVPDHAVRS